MDRLKVSRPLAAAVVCAALSIGCYTAAPLRLQVRSGDDDHSACVRTTDRVFADAGFERIRTMMGVDMFYTPRTSPTAQIALGWGIGAWVNGDRPTETCAVTLEALSDDQVAAPGPAMTASPGPWPSTWSPPSPARQHPFTSQRGEYFDATVRDMAHRLELAFASTP
ncbi:MAG TPA: hypothetical protein VN962_00845, partial [Polyangia bacterium]|nr:hypothetical protein [Polyangia bacterium]